jgi:hypothetical protein
MKNNFTLENGICKLSKDNVTKEGNNRKFRLTMLSGKILEKWWGKFVIDLDSIRYQKKRLNVDFNHDDSIILGYMENFSVDPEGLHADCLIVGGTTESNRIIELIDNEVPLECSVMIQLFGDGCENDFVKKNHTEKVNNREVSEVTIFRKSLLLGNAICSHGTDGDTSVEILKLKKELENMPETQGKTNETLAAATTEKPQPDTAAAADKTENTANLAANDSRKELDAMIELFGMEDGVRLFRLGVSVELAKQYTELKKIFEKQPAAASQQGTPKSLTKTEPASQPKKEPTTTDTYAALTAEIERLKAAIPRGETQPVSQNLSDKAGQSGNSIDGYAAKIQQTKQGK